LRDVFKILRDTLKLSKSARSRRRGSCSRSWLRNYRSWLCCDLRCRGGSRSGYWGGSSFYSLWSDGRFSSWSTRWSFDRSRNYRLKVKRFRQGSCCRRRSVRLIDDRLSWKLKARLKSRDGCARLSWKLKARLKGRDGCARLRRKFKPWFKS
jgi:hypothetical protein